MDKLNPFKDKDLIPIQSPNMQGMPNIEKKMRAAQARGLAKAFYNREKKLNIKAREAYQEGAYKYGDKLKWRADQQNKMGVWHSYRSHSYETHGGR
tara:strand:+ start:743 stop:1030 length:288 start_codon:yes stop_codon:yes gene_type:complete